MRRPTCWRSWWAVAGARPGTLDLVLGALLFGAGSSLWALKAGDRAVLESASARPADRNDPNQRILDNVVEEMAIAGGLPKPAVYVIPDSDPNAFATGTGPQKSSIAVTRGLLEGLNREELQAVVSHEMAHVKNYDIRLMTVVAALVGSVLLISDWGRRGLRFGGARRRGRRDGGGVVLRTAHPRPKPCEKRNNRARWARRGGFPESLPRRSR